MNIVQTALVYAGIPLGIIALFFLLVYGPAELKHSARYRPGRAWTHDPLWYLPHPVAGQEGAHGPDHAGIKGSHAAAIEGSTKPVLVEAVGGASGEW